MLILIGGATQSFATIPPADHRYVGHLLNPRSRNSIESLLWTGMPIAADNDCFKGLRRAQYIAMLKTLGIIPRDRLLWVVAPDVVCDAAATILRFRLWLPVLRHYNLPIAFVAQNGQEDLPVPWDDIACLFIGGDTAWKLGAEAEHLALEAKARGKWVHVGRVNSDYRIRKIEHFADSFDGYLFSRAPKWIPPFIHRVKHQQQGMFTRAESRCMECQIDWSDSSLFDAKELSELRHAQAHGFCPLCTTPLQGAL